MLILTVAVFIENSLHSFGQKVKLRCWHKVLEQVGHTVVSAHAPTHIDRKSRYITMAFRDKAEVVGGGASAVPVATGKGDFILARQFIREPIRQQEFRQSHRIRCDIEDLLLTHPRIIAGRDVAHGVSAAPLGGKPNIIQCHKGWVYRVQRNPVHLDILPCGNVENAVSILLCDLSQTPHLMGKHSPGREANPQHECSRFPLFIDSHGHTKGLKIGGGHCPCLELYRHLPEFLQVLHQTVRQMVEAVGLRVSIQSLFSRFVIAASIGCRNYPVC